jgi:uncharacterized membrane protein
LKDRKHVAWLYGQLPGLVSEGIVPAEAAERLRAYYGEMDVDSGRRWALIVFGVLGAVLIGSGVILLLAHNWDDLSRAVRTVLSFAPLVVALALAGWVVWTGRQSAAWREGAGTALFIAIGSTISLVAQTYHMAGDFGEFMLTWMLLGLPVVYVLGASFAAALYLAGITVWAGSATHGELVRLWYWPLTALVLPHLWLLARQNRYQPRVALLGWTLAICASIAIGLTMGWLMDHASSWVLAYAGYYGLLLVAGHAWFGEAPSMWQRPLQVVGALGTVGLALMLTFRWPWTEMFGAQRSWLAQLVWPGKAGGIDLLPLVWPATAIGLWAARLRRSDLRAILFGALPVCAVVGYTLAGGLDQIFAAMILFNLYLLASGTATLVAGLRERRMGTVNAGMLVLALLISVRFFDSDLGFIVKGLAFIAVGAGFLTTNYFLIKRKGDGHEPSLDAQPAH